MRRGAIAAAAAYAILLASCGARDAGAITAGEARIGTPLYGTHAEAIARTLDHARAACAYYGVGGPVVAIVSEKARSGRVSLLDARYLGVACHGTDTVGRVDAASYGLLVLAHLDGRWISYPTGYFGGTPTDAGNAVPRLDAAMAARRAHRPIDAMTATADRTCAGLVRDAGLVEPRVLRPEVGADGSYRFPCTGLFRRPRIGGAVVSTIALRPGGGE